MKLLIFVCVFAAYISIGSAGTLLVSSDIAHGDTTFNLSLYSPNGTSQIVFETPGNTFLENSMTSVDRFTFFCSNESVDGTLNGNYNIRLLWRDDANIFDSGQWQILSDGNNSASYNLPANSCTDYGVPIDVYPDTNIWINATYLGFNHTVPIGIGLATSSTNGAGVIVGTTSYNFYIPTNSSYAPVIGYVNFSPVDGVLYAPYKLYGDTTTPPTPTPTATDTVTGTATATGTGTGTATVTSTIPGIPTNTCVPGNGTCNPYHSGDFRNTLNDSFPENSSGFKDVLVSNGYTNSVAGAISMLQDWGLIFVVFGMILYVAKLGRYI